MVFNFNSVSNVAKACSMSNDTSTQMLRANHSGVFWLPPQQARLETYSSLAYLRSPEGQGMTPQRLLLFRDGRAVPPDGVAFPSFPLSVHGLILS